MVDISKLKTGAGKGTPPPPEVTNSNLKKPPREKTEKKAVMQFSVPESVQEEFYKEAVERFGFKKGSKSELFLAMWEEYKQS